MTVQAQTLRLGRVGASALLRRRMSTASMRLTEFAASSSSSSSSLLSCCRRALSSSSSSSDNLPYHIVMGMPSLSPTMDSGALAEWYVNEGDAFAAGDAVAKIETDKASIDFEAQDDGFVAKILAAAGDGKDLALGTPIMIVVEEEEHVKAFANYVHPTTTATVVAAAPAAPAAPPKAATAAAAAAIPVAAVAPPVVVAAATPPPAAAAPVAAAAPLAASIPVVAAATAAAMNIATAWGSSTAIKKSSSPLAKTLEANHLAYIEKYGTTGQRPSL